PRSSLAPLMTCSRFCGRRMHRLMLGAFAAPPCWGLIRSLAATRGHAKSRCCGPSSAPTVRRTSTGRMSPAWTRAASLIHGGSRGSSRPPLVYEGLFAREDGLLRCNWTGPSPVANVDDEPLRRLELRLVVHVTQPDRIELRRTMRQ